MSTNHDLLATAFENNNKTKNLNENLLKRVIELGMDPKQDLKLFWIAEQSLKAKLPEEWIECSTEEGERYYFNLRNEDSTWDHPALDHYRQLYEKVKKQQLESSRSSKISLPEIGNKELSSDSNQKSPEPTQSPRTIAAQTLKQKKDAERLGGDTAFWRTRYELLETEKDKLNSQVQTLERDLQSNLLQGARLVEENQRLRQLTEQAVEKLQSSGTTILKHLKKRGFQNDPRKSAGDKDLSSAVEDITRVIQTHLEIDEGDRDERGYSVNWDGALARIKKELEFSFTFEGDGYSVDGVELKVKLEDLTQMLVSYGAYLSLDHREGYIDLFLEHVIRAAKDSTLVPLELVSRAGMKPLSHPGRGDVLLDSPQTINSLRKELEDALAQNKTMGLDLDQKRHQIDILNMKITGLQSRLEDNRAHEELLTSKFNLLNKSIEDIKKGNELSQEKASFAEKIAEVNKLKNDVKNLNNQLNIANKRASDSERRLEASINRETTMKSELSAIEMNLRLKLDKKKILIQELSEQKNDLEKVSHELYNELQNALMVTTRLEKDNDALRDTLDEYRAGDACVDVLREKLEIEHERCRSMEEQITNLRHDLNILRNAYHDLEKKNKKLELQLMESRENVAGFQYELDKHKKRSDILTKDNLSLEEATRNLKTQIVTLNDRIVDIKGSIRVYCRVRPLFMDELDALNLTEGDLEALVHYPDYNLIDFNSYPFEFDRVFEPRVSQDEIFDEVEAFVRSVVNGCRVCIFAYGQTGSGKTHTMEGTERDPGIIHRSIKALLETTSHQEEYHTDITISLMEVYNERVRDLLSLEMEDVDFSLEIKVGTNGTYVDGLSEWPVRCYEEALSLFSKGYTARQAFASVQPSRLLRSHFICLLKVHRTKMSNGQTTTGFLYFVDLAGSERMKLTETSGSQLREAQNINKSLSALGDVISSLSSHHKHVPYRNSKLTFLLQDVLKESAKVLLFITLTPSPVHTGESVSTLQFGSRCRSVQLGPPKKVITHFPVNR